MSVKKNNKAENLYVLVEWVGENRFSVLKLLVPMENEIEVNKKYFAEWKSVPLEVELLFFGTQDECERHCDDITREQNNSKKSKTLQDPKKKKTQRIQNLSMLNESSQDIVDTGSAKSSSKDQIHIGKSKISIFPVSLDDQNIKQCLEDRNRLIETLKKNLQEKDDFINSLRDELETYKSIQDKAVFPNFVKMSMQVIKYLATDQERDELRKISLNSELIQLHPKYPTVNVTEGLYHRTLSMIDQKKTKKAIFKTIITSLIPDVEIWGGNNARYMRDNFGNILNASRDFLNSRSVVLTEDEFKTSFRDLCGQNKRRLGKSQENKNSVSFSSTDSKSSND